MRGFLQFDSAICLLQISLDVTLQKKKNQCRSLLFATLFRSWWRNALFNVSFFFKIAYWEIELLWMEQERNWIKCCWAKSCSDRQVIVFIFHLYDALARNALRNRKQLKKRYNFMPIIFQVKNSSTGCFRVGKICPLIYLQNMFRAYKKENWRCYFDLLNHRPKKA